MGLKRIVGPATLPVSVDEAKAHLAVDHSDHDAMIEGLTRAALAHAEQWCGRAFEPQTWELTLDEFPASEIELPLGPLQSVASVRYIDADGVEQTIDPAEYEVDLSSSDGWVVAVGSWPVVMGIINAVRVRFVAGDETPEDVRHAILLLIGHWYANREAGGASEAIPFGVDALLGLHRRMFV